MKKILLFLTIATIISCKASDEDLMDTVPINNGEETMVLIEGSFTNGAHPTSGTVQIIESATKKFVQFKDFKSDTGPDLKVYLSTSNGNDDFINLGKLQSINGDFFYEIDVATDHNKYNHVLIWCKAFSVLFGGAECM